MSTNCPILKIMLTKNYPFLITTDQTLAALTDIQCIALLEKQEKIYATLAAKQGLELKYVTPLYLQSAVKRNFNLTQNHEEFSQKQIDFLNALAIASGMADGEEYKDKKKIFLLMAIIGNTQQLKERSKEHDEEREMLDVFERALWGAAENGHLECVMHLIEKYKFSKISKMKALEGACQHQHANIIEYLSKDLNCHISLENHTLIFRSMNKRTKENKIESATVEMKKNNVEHNEKKASCVLM